MKWADKNLIKFSKKCKELHPGIYNPGHQEMLGGRKGPGGLGGHCIDHEPAACPCS